MPTVGARCTRYDIQFTMDKENINLEVNRREAKNSNFKGFVRFLYFPKKTLVPLFLVIILNISGNLSK